MNTKVLKACFVSVLLVVWIPAAAVPGHNSPAPSPYKDMIDVPGGAVNRAHMPKIELPPGCDPTKNDTQSNPCFSPATNTPQRPSALPASSR